MMTLHITVRRAGFGTGTATISRCDEPETAAPGFYRPAERGDG